MQSDQDLCCPLIELLNNADYVELQLKSFTCTGIRLCGLAGLSGCLKFLFPSIKPLFSWLGSDVFNILNRICTLRGALADSVEPDQTASDQNLHRLH